MTGHATTMQRDLGRHLQQSIGEVMARHVAVVGSAVSAADVAIMLIEVAVSTTLTAAASIAATVADDATSAAIFDKTLTSIATLAAADRDRSLAAVAARRASPGDDA